MKLTPVLFEQMKQQMRKRVVQQINESKISSPLPLSHIPVREGKGPGDGVSVLS